MPPSNRSAIDVSSLSNNELSEMLRDYGVDVGPINVATRRTYERKLVQLKTGHESPPSKSYEPVDDDEDDDEVTIKRPETRYSPPAATSQARMRREPFESSSYSSSTRIESRPPLSSSRMTTASYTPASRSVPLSQPRPKTESKGIPLWVKLVAVAVVLILVYLIYINMEPSAVSNIPSIPNKMEV